VFIHAWTNNSDQIDLFRSALNLYKCKLGYSEPQIHFDTLNYDAGQYADGDNKKRVFNIHSMWYSIHKANLMSRIWAKTHALRYDWVARCRFDWGPTVPILFDKGDPTAINAVNDCTHTDTCLTDHFAFGDEYKMDTYAQLFYAFPSLHSKGIPFCSEILLGEYLKSCEIKVAQIDAPRQFILH
jgi:hypothetical protein